MVVETGRTGSTELVNYMNARWDQYRSMVKLDMCYIGPY